MSKHGSGNVCPYCFKPFGTRRGADDHIWRKHKHRLRSDDAEAAAKMQHYHQDRMPAGSAYLTSGREAQSK